MKRIILLYTLFISSFFVAQQKHALIIAIGDYSNDNWGHINSLNDVDLITNMLDKQEFDSANIKILKNKEATVVNIKNSLELLIKSLNEGDVVYFHFSGHGQQVADTDVGQLQGNTFLRVDEYDGLDESLVCYNAPKKFEDEPDYKYQYHLVDDEMNYYVNKIRQKIKGSGHLILVLDACHSGTATRGLNDDIGSVRGTDDYCAPEGFKPAVNEQFDKGSYSENDFKYISNDSLGILTVFSGCKSDQLNREYFDRKTGKNYGSLSYFLVNAMTQLKQNASYRNLYDMIHAEIVINWNNNQQPVMEAENKDIKIFGGKYIPRTNFLKLSKLKTGKREVTISGGTLNGLSIGDSIGLYPLHVTSVTDIEPSYSGVVTSVDLLLAEMLMEHAYNENISNYENLKYKAKKYFSNPAPVKVHLKIEIKSEKLKFKLVEKLKLRSNIVLTDNDCRYIVKDSIDMQGNNLGVFIELAHSGIPLRAMTPIKLDSEEKYSKLILNIENAVNAQCFREISCSGEKLDVKVDITSPLILKSGDKLKGEIINNGNSPVYVYLVDILSNEEMKIINELDSKNIPISLQLKPDSSIDIDWQLICETDEYPEPCGKEQIKVICSLEKIDNLHQVVNKLGSSLASTKRGLKGGNPFTAFVDDYSVLTRGASSPPESVVVNNIYFDLNKK